MITTNLKQHQKQHPISFQGTLPYTNIKTNAANLAGLSMVSCDEGEFITCVNEIKESFNPLMSGRLFATLGDSIHSKLEAIVIVMQLIVALEQNEDLSSAKKTAIQELQARTAGTISKILNEINENPNELAKIRDIVVHQRLLMIENLLFLYTNTLKDNSSIQNIDELLIKMPLEINKSVLNSSKNFAQDRSSNAISKSERAMINIFLQDPFIGSHVLRQDIKRPYTDVDSGLELDLPLVNKVDIEFNGPSHYVNGSEVTLEESRKIQQLQELGYQRLALNNSLCSKYSKAADPIERVKETSNLLATFLNIPEVIFFLDLNQQLNAVRQEIRADIKSCKTTISKEYQEITFTVEHTKSKQKSKGNKAHKVSLVNDMANKNEIINLNLNKLKELLSFENKIRNFMKKNYIQRLFEQVDYKNIERVINNFALFNENSLCVQELEDYLMYAQNRLNDINWHMQYYVMNQMQRIEFINEGKELTMQINIARNNIAYKHSIMANCQALNNNFFETNLHLAHLDQLLRDAESKRLRVIRDVPAELGGSSSSSADPSSQLTVQPWDLVPDNTLLFSNCPLVRVGCSSSSAASVYEPDRRINLGAG